MVQMLNGLIAVALLSLGLASCSIIGIQGSGNVVSETRAASGFDGVDLSGLGELTIAQGATESLVIEADDNLMPLITATVENGHLTLGIKPNTNITKVTKLAYTLTVKDLHEITVSGAGTVVGRNIDTDKLTTRLSGAGNLTLSGRAAEQTVEMSGLGSYNGAALQSQRAMVRVAGAGSAEVRVSEQLDATISGAGSVNYIGSPKVSQTISGAGSISKADKE